jgi:hypothetical protein
MNNATLIFCLVFSKILFSQDLDEYDLKPYNDNLNFKILDENEILEKDESIEALILVFNNPIFKNAELSIANNPQLKEIKLFASNQELLKFISDSKLNNLTHLFFEGYDDSILEIPAFPKIEHLTIQSTELVSLKMINASLDKVVVLDIDAVKLADWVTAKSLPNLGLINLKAPLLEVFSIENMPKITQFSYYCSFREMPPNLCKYEELLFISFNNFVPVKVDKCLEKKIKKSVYSNLTVYDKYDGAIISQTLSNDRKE